MNLSEVIVRELQVKNRSRKMNREQSEEEDGVVRTEVLAGDETAETEMEFRLPRGTNQVPDDRTIITGAVGAEANRCDTGQKNRFGPRTAQV